MHKFSTGLVVGLLIGFLLATSSLALADNPIRLIVNGAEVSSNPPPQMIGNRVFVPVRFVAEALGAEVEWDRNDETVIIKSSREVDIVTSKTVDIGGNGIKLGMFTIGDKTASGFYKKVNGDILLTPNFLTQHLLQPHGWWIDHNGNLYDTVKRDSLGNPINPPVGKIKIHKYEGPIHLASLHEVNKKTGLNIMYKHDTFTFY